MGEGVVIDRAPIAADKSTDQQQEGRLRLVEIGDQLIHYLELVTRIYEYPRTSMPFRNPLPP